MSQSDFMARAAEARKRERAQAVADTALLEACREALSAVPKQMRKLKFSRVLARLNERLEVNK